MNRESYPSAEFPLRGDLSAEAGDVIVEVIGLQHIPIAPNPLQEWAVLTDRPSNGDLEWITPIFNEGNVDIVSLIPGDVLVWNGFQWVNAGIPEPTVGAAVISVANQGLFWSAGFINPFLGTPLNTNPIAFQAANSVVAYQFILPFSITLQNITYKSNANWSGSGGHFSFAIYSADGTSKLIDTGAQSPSAAVNVTVTLGAAVTLPPGVYWFAQTADNTNSSLEVLAAGTITFGWLYPNLGVQPKLINAQNTSTAGAMPSTLGTLTTSVTNSAGNGPVMSWVAFEV
jgi:hypothetical protein